MDEKELNELRLHANEILRLLHKAKAVGQIQLLFMYALLSIKDLDPQWFPKFIKDNTPAPSTGEKPE